MKKIIILLILAFVLSLNGVFGAFNCGFQNPASGAYISNFTAINISFSSDDTNGQNESFNATVRLTSTSLTRNNSLTSNLVYPNVTNRTATFINMTFNNTVVIGDGSDYTLDCQCYAGNQTANCNSTRTNMIVDRTKPAAPTGITYTNPVKDGNTITATMNIELANKCWIRFGGQNVERRATTLSGTGATRTCTFTVGRNNPPNSDYQMHLSADDGTNETFSNTNNVIIRAVASDGGGLLGDTIIQDGALTKAGGVFGKVDNKAIAIILIAVLGLLYLKNKNN